MSVTYESPTSVDEAISLLDDDALPFAGGVALVLLMNAGLIRNSRLVSLAHVSGLRSVEQDGKKLRIGSMCTHHQLSRDPLLQEHLPNVSRAFGQIGNIRVRSWGTVGGNLANGEPAQDPPTMLSALGAQVVTHGPSGTRSVPVIDLCDGPLTTVLEPNELIIAIEVPLLDGDECMSYVKFLPRTADDFATVSAGVRVRLAGDGLITEATLICGAVGPTPIACDEAAAVMIGHHLDDEAALDQMAAIVQDTVSPATDARGSAEYKHDMIGVFAKRAFRSCQSTEV